MSNENKLYVVFNERLYNTTGEAEVIAEFTNVVEAENLLKTNKEYNYSIYPANCYEKNNSKS